MLLAALLVVCGALHVVGSDRDTSLQLDDGTRRIALAGPIAASLVGTTWPRVCVVGERTGRPAIGASFEIVVARVRPVGDGHHVPIVGVLRRSSRGDVLVTGDGHRFALRIAPSQIDATLLGRRVWLVGRWTNTGIVATQMGPF